MRDEKRPASATRPSAPVEGIAPGAASARAPEGRRPPRGARVDVAQRPLLRPLDLEPARDGDAEEEAWVDGEDWVAEDADADGAGRAATPCGARRAWFVASLGAAALVALVRAASPRFARTIRYACPILCATEMDRIQKSLNDENEAKDRYYDNKNACVYANGGAALAAMRNGSCWYDGWSHGYPAAKASLRAWKEAAFLPHVRDGADLYESACGLGLNMLLTAEILHEHGVRDVTFYGNDYTARSVATANRFWDDPHVGALAAAKGRICRADSRDLAGVPDGAFDLAYTGYLQPLLNAFYLAVRDRGVGAVEAYCASDPELAAREQAAMEVWFASWVSEMVRITKPGGYVAIESGAESWCAAPKDWGGVDRGWWGEDTIAKYGWDVDPRSVLVMDAADQRYHVLLKKNGA